MSICNYLQTYLPESEFPLSRNGWFYPYDSILQPLFDKYLLSLFESGVFKRIMETHDSKKLECPVKPIVLVDLPFVLGIFCILVGGVILSMLTFLLERNGFEFLKKGFNCP